MILDVLSRASMYKGICPAMDLALDFIEKTDLNALPNGKTPIDGDRVYINITEYETKDEPGTFEAHDLYADIQIVLSGVERMDYCEREETSVAIPYNPEKDIVRIDATGSFSPLAMKPGLFVVFFPQDAHRPNLTWNEKHSSNRKLVVKVRMN